MKKLLLSALVLTSAALALAQEKTSPSAEDTVRSLYSLVTFEKNTTPDWDKVRALFDEKAVIRLRTTREGHTSMDVDGFVQDFVDFAKLKPVQDAGFSEKIIRLKTTEYRAVASIAVLYEAQIPGHPMGPQQGIDWFHLAKFDGVWKITSIVNEQVSAEAPLPPELREK